MDKSKYDNIKPILLNQELLEDPDKPIETLLDQLINSSKISTFTKMQILINTLNILCMFALKLQGIFYIVPIAEKFNLSAYDISVFFFIPTISSLLFTVLFDWMNTNFSTKYMIYFSYVISILSALALGFCDYLLVIHIIRFFESLPSVYFFLTRLIYLNEYLPSRNRGFLNNLLMFGSIVYILIPLLMLFTIPNMSPNELSFSIGINLIFFFIIPFLIVLIVGYKTGPRSLILKGNNEEAKEMIEKITDRYLKQEEYDLICKQVIESNLNDINSKDQLENKLIVQQQSTYLHFLYPRYLKTSILIYLIRFIYGSYWGFLAVVPLTLVFFQNEEEQEENILGNKIIISFLITYSIQTIRLIPSLFLADNKKLGRRGLMIVFPFIAGVMIIFSMIFTSLFNLFIGLFYLFFSIVFNFSNIYISEVYPTYMRSKASQLSRILNSLGELAMQFIYLNLQELHKYLPYYLQIGLCFASSILAYLLPVEMNQKNIK